MRRHPTTSLAAASGDPRAAARRRVGVRDESGFSLIELMVVLTILAILVSIAIPSLLAATRPAADRRAQTLLHTAMLAGRAAAVDRDTYAGLVATDLAANEDSLQFVPASTSAESVRNEVSVRTGSIGIVDYLLVTSRSASGRCFELLDRSDSPTGFHVDDNASSCAAADVDPLGTWVPAW